jgi:hypothetical protein
VVAFVMPALTTAPSLEVDDESRVEEPRRHVRLTDRRLVEMAVQTASAVDWDALSRLADGRFDPVVKRVAARTRVAASGALSCSVAEMRHVLRPPTSETYASAMRELYGQDFIYGTIVHRVGAERDMSRTMLGPEHSVRQRHAGIVITTSTADVDVRTTTFVKRHLLARSEQWCYVDAFHSLDKGDGGSAQDFGVSMTSLHPDDVFLGKTKATVSALTNVTVAYEVRAAGLDKTNRPQVQVGFHADFEASELSASKPRHQLSSSEGMYLWHSISERALVQRLKDMAARTQHLYRVVQRRRLSIQVFVDVKTLHPPNTRCACCTKMLTTILGRNKKQCHLCGFYVCEQCSRQHEIERGRVKRFLVRICEHCMERVDEGVYDNLSPGAVSPPRIHPDTPGRSGRDSNVLEQLLQDELIHSSDNRRSAVKTIIRTMAELETSASPTVLEEKRLSVSSSDDDYLEVLQRLSDQATPRSSTNEEAFPVSNSSGRTYLLEYKPGTCSDSLPDAPIPADEEKRLEWVGKANISEIKNRPELELLCDMARKELGCETGVMTMITKDKLHVLASNDPSVRNFVNSRENAICAHTIMNKDAPNLVAHPEADIRFSKQNMAREMDTRFYFGFPLTAADGTAIGTFCCLDSESHRVTQSQYATMSWLSRSASRLVQDLIDEPK